MNVSAKLKAAGLPGPRCVATIEPSRDKYEGRCYVCFDAHRSDDDKPYLFVTEDYGQTWKSVTGNLPAFGSTRVLREDITNADVLYCGTEFGIWASVNRGRDVGEDQQQPADGARCTRSRSRRRRARSWSRRTAAACGCWTWRACGR